MKWLGRLKAEGPPNADATKPPKPAPKEHEEDLVGFVAYPLAPFHETAASTTAANDPSADLADLDHCCWPHSEAMNGREIDTLSARLVRFTDKGVNLVEAERLADKLVLRDREGDDRRLCLECINLKGHGQWRCGEFSRADMAPNGIAPELVRTLQRCPAYRNNMSAGH